MSIPAQGAEGAETMTAGIGPRIRKAVFEIASRRIKSGAPGLAPATAEAIARIIGLEAASALAAPRADSDERTAGEVTDGMADAALEHWRKTRMPGVLDGAGAHREWLRGIVSAAMAVQSTPAQPAGVVPDSLRALSEAASEDWDTNEATPYILGPPIDGEIDRFEVIARAPHGYDKNGDDIRKWQANRMFAVAAVNFVRSLLASHSAGQSAGSGAGQGDPCAWAGGNDTCYCRTCGEEYRYGREDKPPCPRKPAPDSTRTGAVETERLRAIADRLVTDACELPDRTSPEDQPEMLLVTGDELHSFLTQAMQDALAAHLEASSEQAEG